MRKTDPRKTMRELFEVPQRKRIHSAWSLPLLIGLTTVLIVTAMSVQALSGQREIDRQAGGVSQITTHLR